MTIPDYESLREESAKRSMTVSGFIRYSISHTIQDNDSSSLHDIKMHVMGELCEINAICKMNYKNMQKEHIKKIEEGTHRIWDLLKK